MNELELTGNYGEVRDGRLYGPERGMPGIGGLYKAGQSRKQRVDEAMRLYVDVLGGRTDPVLLREAVFPQNDFIVREVARRYPNLYGDKRGQFGLRETMSVTDYQALYVDVLDRLYYGYYNDYPISNMPLVKVHDLRDFRQVSRYLLDGIVGPMVGIDPAAPAPQRALSGPVPQDGATYPTTNTAPIQYQPKLYQAMASINWRAFVNDDLGIFRDVAKRLAMSGRMTIAKFITTLYTASTGLNTSLYSSAYNNIINVANGASINNPPLGAQGLMDALKVLAKQKDAAGNPIMVTGRLKLWFGPSLIAVANNLLKATALQVSVEGGTQNAQGFPTQFLNTNPDWIMSNIDLVPDPWIPIVCTATGTQNTMWGITVDPNSVERPSAEVGFLQGFKEPQLFSKLPNTQRLGGGVDAMLGDFNTMDSDTKIVTVFGGTQIDGRTTVASTGQSV